MPAIDAEVFSKMADNIPVAASGPREPTRRPRPIPKVVREACLLMVYGDPDDEDGTPVDFITAAKSVGMRPDTLRRYLARPGVIALLRAERRAFREAICAGNELALQRVRDNSGNAMSKVAAVKVLEQLNDEASRPGAASRDVSPGFTIYIHASTPSAHTPSATTTKPAPMLEHVPAKTYSDDDVLWLDGSNRGSNEADDD